MAFMSRRRWMCIKLSALQLRNFVLIFGIFVVSHNIVTFLFAEIAHCSTKEIVAFYSPTLTLFLRWFLRLEGARQSSWKSENTCACVNWMRERNCMQIELWDLILSILWTAIELTQLIYEITGCQLWSHLQVSQSKEKFTRRWSLRATQKVQLWHTQHKVQHTLMHCSDRAKETTV